MDIRVLGPLEVYADGTDVTPTSPNQRTVLAVLAAHPDRHVRADRRTLWTRPTAERRPHAPQLRLPAPGRRGAAVSSRAAVDSACAPTRFSLTQRNSSGGQPRPSWRPLPPAARSPPCWAPISCSIPTHASARSCCGSRSRSPRSLHPVTGLDVADADRCSATQVEVSRRSPKGPSDLKDRASVPEKATTRGQPGQASGAGSRPGTGS